jgi:hypothetical protein
VVAAWFYINAAYMFALPLVHDRGYEFWPAMRLSQRTVNGQLLPIIALVLLAGLIGWPACWRCASASSWRPRRGGLLRLRLRGSVRRRAGVRTAAPILDRMARGWESKSIEEQQDAAARERAARQAPAMSEADKARAQEREGLRLARARTLATLQTACNPRHRAMLEETLAHLDAQLTALDAK